MRQRSTSTSRELAALRRQLDETKDEARAADQDLHLLLSSSTLAHVPRVDGFDQTQLPSIERTYRLLAASPTLMPGDFDVDHLERLIALYLGQLIVDNYGGEWGIYSGRHHVSSRVLPFLDDGMKVLDVFLFCAGLHLKMGVPGASQGESLKRYFESARGFAIPS